MFDYSRYKVVQDTQHFQAEKLQTPDFYLWPGFFWIINEQLDKEKIYEQLKDMVDHGAKSVCVHVEPLDLGKVITCHSLLDDVKYLSKAYMDYLKYISDVCVELGMHLWMYDEAAWPSGQACGQVYARNPRAFEKKELIYSDFTMGRRETGYTVPEGVFCAGILRDGAWVTKKPGERLEYMDGDEYVRVFHLKTLATDQYGSGTDYDIDFASLFNKEATETFIELTHERIKDYIGGEFGKSMFFTFTDEPAVSGITEKSIPWVDGFDQDFEAQYGYSLIDYAPYLLAAESPDESLDVQRARVDLFDFCSKRFADSYLKPIQDWCRDNGLLSSGHLWQEGAIRFYACGGAFHLLRGYRAMDVPGLDYIFREYYPGNTPVYAKYPASVSRQKGVKYTMTESYCLAGSGLTLAEMKIALDQQVARGANLLVMGAYPYSTREHLMAGERPHFGPVNPYWRYQGAFHEYAARLSYLMTRGDAVVNAAVYMNMRDIWAGAATRERAYDLHERIYRALYKEQVDYDYIDDDVLAGIEGRVEGGRLVVGAMTYDTIIVPESEWIDEQALVGLTAFAEQGGKVIVVGERLCCDGGEGPVFAPKSSEHVAYATVEHMARHAKPLARISPSSGQIRIAKRVANGVAIYFLCNESAGATGSLEFTFDELEDAVLCEVESGALRTMDAKKNDTGTRIILAFEPRESKVLLFGTGEAAAEPERFQASDDRLELAKGWRLRPLKQYKAGLHDFEIVELADQAYMETPLKNWGRVLGEYFSGDVEYVVEVDCPIAFAGRRAKLELGDVRYACEAYVNEAYLGRKQWGTYSFLIEEGLNPGVNRVRVVVTNTLANAILSPEAESIWNAKTDAGRPKGRLWDGQTKNLEKDSVISGLLGPVRITFE